MGFYRDKFCRRFSDFGVIWHRNSQEIVLVKLLGEEIRVFGKLYFNHKFRIGKKSEAFLGDFTAILRGFLVSSKKV